MVLADAGEMIQVRSIVGELDLMGRSGSPFFSQSTGRIIGLLSVSEGEGNNQTIILAPARYLDMFIKKKIVVPLMESIR